MTPEQDAANMAAGSCKWSEDDDGNWFTGCGNAFTFIDGAPTENGMKFCCYCGKVLEEVRYEELP